MAQFVGGKVCSRLESEIWGKSRDSDAEAAGHCGVRLQARDVLTVCRLDVTAHGHRAVNRCMSRSIRFISAGSPAGICSAGDFAI